VRILVAGWFSFEAMGATAGDVHARDVACRWLEGAGHDYDVATAAPFTGGVDWRAVDPALYSHVLFVCGPFGNGPPLTEFLARFDDCRLVGLNLSMLQPLEEWNPFFRLFERDSSEASRPDISFLSEEPLVPVVGVVLVHPQDEYRDARHASVNQAIAKLLESREVSIVHIDTRLDENGTGLRTPAEVESLIARMDVVVTTRLHGTVFALKHGVPPVVVDPIAGGAKVFRQAQQLRWPVVLVADDFAGADLEAAFDRCLTPESRAEAKRCAANAVEALAGLREELLQAFAGEA
jgi:hypothetical protein